ncbi:hypothetical protein [Winogradskyella sp. R77965]|uniref:hypothetical protein n=1 Tax=Winogradskyella sp. R77965 TaxID=3093872 RepID=UPI0037DC76CA
MLFFLYKRRASDDDESPINPDPENTRMAVVNVDIMQSIDPSFGDVVYVGDNGVLSSSSGTFWNPCQSLAQLFSNISDEFGAPTMVDLNMTANGSTQIGFATNELQDNGISTSGISEQGFEWQGLIADSEYDLSFYIYAYVEFGNTTTFDITHADGTISTQPNSEPTWLLPGEINKDYILVENIKPYEISNGVYGFKIDNLNSDGAIMGFQLKGLVTNQN